MNASRAEWTRDGARVMLRTRKTTVLVADDEPQVIALLSAVLTGPDFKMLEARNGKECLEVARKEKPDVILMDVRMPALNGIDACRALKSDPLTAGSKVVLLTALAQEETFSQGVAAGADAVVTKPFSPLTLVAKIQDIAKRGLR